MPPNLEAQRKTANDLRKHWKPRNDRFEDWYSIREMEDKYAKEGWESIALNGGRTFFDVALFFLSHRAPTIRVAVLGKPDEEQERSADAEYFLAGVHRAIDRGRSRSGEKPWVEALAESLLLTGWYAYTRGSDKDPDGKAEFFLDVYDPSDCYPEWGNGRMEKLAHIYSISGSKVKTKANKLGWKAEFELTGSTDEVTLYDFWEWVQEEDGEEALYNTVWVEGRGVTQKGSRPGTGWAVLVEPTIKDEVCIPIQNGPVNGWSTGSKRPDRKRMLVTHLGESILEAGRTIWDAKNRWTTDIMQKSHDAAVPSFTASSRGGDWVVAERDMIAGVVIPKRLDEELTLVNKGDIPVSIPSTIMPILEQAEQRASLSDPFFGNINDMDLAGAGFALSLLEPSALSKLGSFAKKLEDIGQDVDTFYLEDYRTGEFEPIQLATRDADGSDSRKIFFREFNKDMLPETSYVDWEVQLSTPSQLIQAIAIGRQAIPSGDLLDIDTFLEKIAKVDDIERVKDGIQKGLMMRDPRAVTINVAREMIQEAANLEAEGDTEMAQHFRQAAESTLGALGAPQQGQTTPEGIPGSANPAIARALNA